MLKLVIVVLSYISSSTLLNPPNNNRTMQTVVRYGLLIGALLLSKVLTQM